MTGKLPKEYCDIRYLVVDDKPFIRNLVTSMLVRSGAQHIARAENGEEAVDLLQRAGGRCDCLISDWNMEPVNGLQLLQRIRAKQVLHTPPDLCFILVTGTSQADVVNAAISLDVNAYLVKPVSQVKLIEAVKRASERTWSPKGPKHYLAVQGVETPPFLKESAKASSPWVMLKGESAILTPREDHHTPIKAEAAPDELRDVSRTEEIFIKNKRQRSIHKIKIGSALAEDVQDADGKLVLTMGTILDKKLLSRLREVVSEDDEKARIWVGDAPTKRK
jgi:two-component system chemotaxis response regulator CheY